MSYIISTALLSIVFVLPLLLVAQSDDTINFHHDIDDNTVTVGHDHACGLEDVGSTYGIGGEIVCWGDGTFGQLDSPPVSLQRYQMHMS